MSIEVADLVAKLRMDSSHFARGMTDAEGRARSGAVTIGHALAGLSHYALEGLGASLKAATDYQTMLGHVQANTTLTNAQMATMSAGIQAMAAQTGAPLEQLATGFMHVSNFGFSAADSLKILRPAMESALSTGDDVSAVAEVLAKNMHEFHIKTADAAHAMNVLHYAAALGNATLGDFVHSTTAALNVASGLGVSFVDVTAALSTLTRAGQTAQQANNSVRATMLSIIKPTAAARDELASLSRVTGINLSRDFTTTGLKARGLHGVLQDTRAAVIQVTRSTKEQQAILADYSKQLIAHHTPAALYNQDMARMTLALKDPNQLLGRIFTQQLALRTAMQLTGNQAGDYTQTIKTLSDTYAGKLNPTQEAFRRQQQSVQAQMAKLNETLQVMAIQVGTVLLPAITRLVQNMMPMVRVVADWVAHNKELALALVAGLALMGPLGATLSTLHSAIRLVGAATKIWSVAQAALNLIMDANPIALVVLAIAGLVIGVKLAYDHIKPFHDAVNAVWGALQKWAAGLPALAASLGKALGGAFQAIGRHLHDLPGQVGRILAQLPATILAAEGNLLHAELDLGRHLVEGIISGIKSMASALKNAVAGIGGGIVDHLKGLLGIHSPSAVFHDLGRQTMEGFANGLTAGGPGAKGALAAQLAGLTRGMGSGYGGLQPVGAFGAMDLAGIGTARGGYGGGGNVFNFTVTIAGGHATVTGSGSSDIGRIGQQVMADFAAKLDSAERQAGVPPRRLQPGARAV